MNKGLSQGEFAYYSYASFSVLNKQQNIAK